MIWSSPYESRFGSEGFMNACQHDGHKNTYNKHVAKWGFQDVKCLLVRLQHKKNFRIAAMMYKRKHQNDVTSLKQVPATTSEYLMLNFRYSEVVAGHLPGPERNEMIDINYCLWQMEHGQRMLRTVKIASIFIAVTFFEAFTTKWPTKTVNVKLFQFLRWLIFSQRIVNTVW